MSAPLTKAEIAAQMATGHSVFAPSSAEMTTTCLAALVVNMRLPDRQTYEAAEGTVAHEIGEEWVKTGVRPDHRVGETVDINGYDVEIDETMLSFVEDYYNGCMELAETADWWSAENKVDISDLTPIPNQGGTGDFMAIHGRHLTIVDLKYGKEPVYAYYPDDGSINKQLAIYAWGLFLEYDWLYDFDRITIKICQPRLPHVWSEHTITREELIAFADFVRERWALAWTKDAPRTPSLKGCRWCKDAECAARYLFIADDLEGIFEDPDTDMALVTYQPEQLAEANGRILDYEEPFPDLPDPGKLTTEALGKLLHYRKFVENFFNRIHEELLGRAFSDEEEIPYWKIVMSRTNRKMVDDTEYIEQECEEVGLSRDDLYATKMISPAELEKVLHKKAKMALKDAKAFIRDRGLAVQPPGRKTLAPVTDRRHELPRDGDVFDSIEDIDI